MDFSFLGQRKVLNLVLGFLFCAIGMGICFHGAWQLFNAYRLAGPAHRDSGHVERLFTTYGSKSHRTYYHVGYSFVTRGMRVTVTDETISFATWDRLQPGTLIPVRYLDDDPTVCELDLPGSTDRAVKNGWETMLVPLFFVAAGFYVALFAPKGNK